MSALQANYPAMLSIAGSDCSAGAGLQADLKAGVALGCYPLTVLTCAVNEVPGVVESIVPMEASFVLGQLRLCLEHFPVTAVKAGMLYAPAIVHAVADCLKQEAYASIPLVVDPVMIATAGESLMLREAIEVYEQHLFPRATLLTPNRDEASSLLDGARIESHDELRAAAATLQSRYGCAVLLKGGHLAGESCLDVLVDREGRMQEWTHARIHGVSTHGTGCTLSAAVAAGLSHGKPLVLAVEEALDYTTRVIATSLCWESPCAMQALAPR